MKQHARIVFILLALPALLTLNSPLSTLHAQGTAFTYQGQLQNNGAPASGTYNLTFSIYTNSTSGTAVAGPVTNSAVAVTNGLFTVTIDFGSGVWNGQTNWLQIGVETNNATSFTTLALRQQLTPVPYAIAAENMIGTILTSQLTSIGNTNGGIGNFFIGASGNTTSSGADNTANGLKALSSNTSGSRNTANGADALLNNLSGIDNTADGVSALFENQSGTLNIALGYQAGFNISTGSSNIDIGNPGLSTDSQIIRIGALQAATYIAGTIYGNGGGLTNVSVVANQLTSIGNNNGGSGNFFAGPSGNATTSGLNNTAYGLQALNSITNGSFNTANGAYALYSDASGFGNTAYGYSALYANTNSGNTAVGFEALDFNTSGFNNTANGFEALDSNTSGSLNTASGMSALLFNTSGANNTADGVSALQSNINGSFNVANGNSALLINTNGSDNTAVGFQALSGNTSGSYNVALGYQAGNNVTTGSSNIDIGNEGVSGDTNIIRIGSGQTQTFIAGVINGNGGGLTNLNVIATQLTTIGNTNGGMANFFVGFAGNATTTASFNTAAGTDVLVDDTTGGQNTGYGAAALAANTSGANNTANGTFALEDNTVGGENTADGAVALAANTSGSYNTANGNTALENNTNGSENTAVGQAALIANTSGSFNIALGYQAGNNITTGSSNIDIGNEGVSGDTNIIRIGSGQTATYLAGNLFVSGAVFSNGVDVVSDRNAKENFSAVNPQSVLASVTALPISQWNYKTDRNVEHMGPMAQDFHAAFGLNGPDDKHISMLDEGGVALAAIKGLNEKLNERDAEIADLKARLDALEKIVLKQKMN